MSKMDRREDALRSALEKNQEESQRWKMYRNENELAIDNMNIFGKMLTVDVMVPVGVKAFIPGHLLHTNEVLVGHYQGYFSQCTTFKAREICEWRIKMAEKYVNKLETEKDMWLNKMWKPYTDGVLPSGEEREIIEEFNEEAEKLWKENHKLRVKQAKKKEREEREKCQKDYSKDIKNSEYKSNADIFKILEDAELVEELEQELDTLQLDEINDEIVRKMISGEIKLPQVKTRLAHNMNDENTKEFQPLSSNIVNINYAEARTHMNSNNNVHENPEILNKVISMSEEFVEEALPEEVTLIKEQAKYLNAENQIGFYDYQIQIIRQKLDLLPLRTQDDLNEKLHLLNVLEHLEDLLEIAEETVGEKELADNEDDENVRNIPLRKDDVQYCEKFSVETPIIKPCDDNKSKEKYRISFALENHTLEFRNHETVTQLLPHKQQPQRDIVKLNNNEEKDKYVVNIENSLNKTQLIQAKVENNLKFMEENQSQQNFDLVKQIIEKSKGDISTLHIKFKHSQQEAYKSKDFSMTPGNPADIYKSYKQLQNSLEDNSEQKVIFVNGYEGEEQVKVPVMKEADKQTAFSNPKAEFSNPFRTKSILKNTFPINKEHYGDKHQNIRSNINSKKKICKKKEDCLSAYYKVMNDVVEKPITEPEPLPGVNFIDAHTPRRRISRFKKLRQENENT